MKPADSLLVTCENQRDDAGSGLSDVARRRRIGRRAVLGGLTSDNAAHKGSVEEPRGVVSEPCASHGQEDAEEG
jgi:hypothetical protein